MAGDELELAPEGLGNLSVAATSGRNDWSYGEKNRDEVSGTCGIKEKWCCRWLPIIPPMAQKCKSCNRLSAGFYSLLPSDRQSGTVCPGAGYNHADF